MLRLIIGRIGSGKTEKMYAEIERLLRGGESVPVVIVPEQYSFETEKNILQRLGTVDANAADVYSFTFLARLLLKQTAAGGGAQLSDSARVMLMSLALESIGDQLEFYEKARYSAGFMTEMLGMVKELRQCAVTPEALLELGGAMEPCVLKSKLTELSLIQKAYTTLAGRTFQDDETLLDVLHDNREVFSFFHHKTVFIDGFRGFTAQELRIIEDMLATADDVYVTLCTDRVTGLHEKQSVFAHTRRTAARLMQSAETVCGGKTQVLLTEHPNRCGDPFLAALEEQLYAPAPEKICGTPESITLCEAESFAAECDFVAANIKRLLMQGAYRCRDIAVIARDISAYERQIKAALQKYEIPVYIDKRQPVQNQPLMIFAGAALEIAAHGFTTEAVMRMLKTGLTGAQETQIAQLENYALLWQVRGARWCSDFKGHPEGFGQEMREQDAETLEAINTLRREITVPLAAFRETLKDADGNTAAQALYRLLIRLGADEHLKTLAQALDAQGEPDLAQEQDRVWDVLIEILDDIAAAVGEQPLSAKRFAALFRLMASCYSMGALPVGLDEVAIGAADRIQISSPKAVFAVGLNDGVFPYVQTSKQILSRAERETLRAQGMTLSQSAEEDVMEERCIAYHTLCAATQKLFVSYPRRTLTGAETAPSELVMQLRRIFPDLQTVDTAALPPQAWVGSKASAFETLAKHYRKNDVPAQTLRAYFEEDGAAAGKLRALRRAAAREPFALTDAAVATRLFGRHIYISATRAETFYKCPFEYFCKFGIRLQPPKTAELDPMQRGTIVHFVLENLLRTYDSAALQAMSESQINEAVMAFLQQYFEQNMIAGETQSDRFRFLYESLGDTVCAIAQRMVREFAVSEFVPVDFELPIEPDSEVQPLEIPLSSGGSIRIRGTVDRVDLMQTQDQAFVRVVDYKLGGKNFQLGDVFYGLNMQMLIYLFSIWKNGAGKYADVVPAGILYMPAKAAAANLGRNASAQDVLERQLADSRMNGLVLDDSRVIVGMDRSRSGLFIPVKYNEKKSTFTGSLMDFTCFSGLFELVTGKLREMGDRLHAGRIEADPVFSRYSGSAYTDACRYCDYKSVCAFEKDDPRTEILPMDDAACFAALRGGKA